MRNNYIKYVACDFSFFSSLFFSIVLQLSRVQAFSADKSSKFKSDSTVKFKGNSSMVSNRRDLVSFLSSPGSFVRFSYSPQTTLRPYLLQFTY